MCTSLFRAVVVPIGLAYDGLCSHDLTHYRTLCGESKAYDAPGGALLTLPRAEQGVGAFTPHEPHPHWTLLPA